MMRRNEKGQAAVEALFSIPVMLILFLIGFELFAITWNAQFVHVRARYEVLKKADHRACPRGGTENLATAPVTSTVQGDTGLWQKSQTHTLRQTAVIKCQ